MNIIYLLHFYQPDFQFKQALEDVYYNSYKKIFEAVDRSKNGKIVINITASTIEMLNNYGVGNIIQDLKDLYSKGKVEFTATSLAHVLLSHSSHEQALRQVKLDIDKKAWYLNVPREKIQVLFPPELSINNQVLEIARELDLKAVISSHSSIKNFNEDDNKLMKSGLKMFVRSLKLSRILESPEIKEMDKFYEVFHEEGLKDDNFYLVAHDAEILGRQNPEKIEMFGKLLNDPKIHFSTFEEELNKSDLSILKKKLLPGTWEKLPIHTEYVDVHWKNPNNKVHKYQWKLSELIVKNIENFPEINKRLELQTHLDYCQYSCQYWWASSYPFWSPGIVSHAAWTWLYLGYRVYYELSPLDKKAADIFKKRVEKFYMYIIKELANYDITKWHEKNIHYYDQFIHPLKLKYEV